MFETLSGTGPYGVVLCTTTLHWY